MAREKIRVGIIGANARYGWGRSAQIPALKALPEFETTAICTSRQETADEAAKHFGIPLAFAHPAKMVNHSDVDLVSICVRVPFHHQMGMAALNAGKHLVCEWPLAATTEQAAQMHQLAAGKGLHHMVGLQARGAPAINRARDLSGAATASCCQRAASLAPITGTVSTQAGGWGIASVVSALDQSAIRLAFSTMVPMPR